MAEINVYPSADLAGVWELTQPLPVDGGTYLRPTLVYVDSDVYLGEDGLADALQPAAVYMPSAVTAGDVAILVTSVSDATDTVELTGADAPVVVGENEWQTIASWQTSGTFTITFDGETTSALAWNADEATVLAAMEALSNIAPGDVVVYGDFDGDGGEVDFEFTGAYAHTDVPIMTCSTAYVAPVNEVQRLVSDRTGGTFTLTYDGQTTASTTYNATAATVQTRLRALANLATTEVTVTGGPVNSAPVIITFNGPSLSGTPVNQITVTDSGTGGTGIVMSTDTNGVAADGQTVTLDTAGVADRTFSLVTSFNIPQAGNAYEPQLHVWALELVAGDVDRAIDVTVADHDTLHSYGIGLMVWRFLDVADPVEDLGTETNGQGAYAAFGTITPTTSGAVLLAVVAKGNAGGYDVTSDPSSAPAGYTAALTLDSDSTVTTIFASGGVTATAETPDPSAWILPREWATGLMALKPAGAASGGTDLFAVVDTPDEADWIEIGVAAGSMFEVLEFDLTPVPAGAVILGARFAFGHGSDVRNKLRAVIVGINADDSIVLGSEQQVGYLPIPVSTVQTVESATWYELADGSPVSGYDRLGIALISSDRHPALNSHKVYWVRGIIEYEPGGPVVSGVAGPVSPGDPVTWTYSSDSGLAQTHYQVRVIAGAGQDPDTATVAANVLDAAAGEIVYDSGQIAGDLVRSRIITDGPLGRGAHTVAVRSWARLPTGAFVPSAWGVDDFDITGSPGAPPAQAVDPVFDDGAVDVEVSVPAGVSRAWLARSNDSGATWELTEDSPYAVVASTTENLLDYGAPFQSTTVRYGVAFDTGPASETTTFEEAGTGDVSTPVGSWYLLCPESPGLNSAVQVKAVKVERRKRTVVAEQPGNSVSASSLPLARRYQMQFWIFDAAERARIDALLDSGLRLRLVDIWGERVDVRPEGAWTDSPQRWRPLPTESTGLRDAHVYDVDLIEEAGA